MNTSIDCIVKDVLNKDWDRLDKEIPTVLLYILYDPNNADSVTLVFRIIPVVNPLFAEQNTLRDLAQCRLDLHPSPSKHNVALYETTLDYDYDCDDDPPDLIVGFIPHPNARKPVKLNISIEHVKRIPWKYERVWTVFVQPKTVQHITPIVYGKYIFPYIFTGNIKLNIESCDDCIEMEPTMLCAELTIEHEFMDIYGNINIDIDDRILIKGIDTSPGFTLPDLEHVILQQNAQKRHKTRHDIIFEELMQTVWHPNRLPSIIHDIENY